MSDSLSPLFPAEGNKARTPDEAKEDPFFNYGSGSFSIGSSYGIHPNQTNTYLQSYFFGEGDHSFSVKGLPLHATFRISNEPYRSGKPSYFRINFDALSYRQQQLSSLRKQLEQQAQSIKGCQDSVQLLSGQWSYWNLKKQEWEAKVPEIPTAELPGIGLPVDSLSLSGLPLVPSIDLPELPGTTTIPKLPGTGTIPTVTAPEIPEMNLDKITEKLSAATGLITQKQQQLQQLKDQNLALQQKYEQLLDKKQSSFFNGIQRADLGLSTLSPSSLSHNRVPMQGIHVAGTVRRAFYDVAAGLTLPNQLFSNQAFDQVLTNSGNLFNIDHFFAVNSIRFVSSAVVGYGEAGKNCVTVETFYTGKNWEQIRTHVSGDQQVASNLSFCLTPKRLPTLTWTGTVGQSFSTLDSTQVEFVNKLAYASTLNWKITKLKGDLKLNYRKLGDSYDGWAQGIYLRGAEHREASYRQTITGKLSVLARTAADVYHGSDSLRSVRTTRQAGTEIQWKLFQHTTFIASYTLLQLQNDTLSRGQTLSHLGRLGLYHNRTLGEWSINSSLDAGYAQIAGVDSNQTLVQLTGHSSALWHKWEFGMKVAYTDFTGLVRLDGTSWMIQPEIGYKGQQFSAHLNYQYLKSEQFGTASGFQFNFQFKFSELFTLTYSAQRWLPTEYTFFMINDPGVVKPLYIRGKLTLYLK